jgi:hypothetical protein
LKSRKIARKIDPISADTLIANLIEGGQPGLVGRLGGTEARFLGEYLKIAKFSKVGISPGIASKFFPKWKRRSKDIHMLSGFYFESWADIKKFSNIYITALTETDILGAWGVAFTWVETRALRSKEIKIIPVGFTAPSVNPYIAASTPWSRALDGKKVLVVSGFSASISSQHQRIAEVFDKSIYPKFELVTIKAPLVSGLRDQSGKSWFDLLEDMQNEIKKAEYDVALIAAGAFSYPLAAYVKSQGKIGIHSGGGLQLFFGIMGNRWNNSPEVLEMLNDFWVRPSANERPITAEAIEDACYW